MPKGNGFYNKLDSSKEKSGLCSCLTFAILFFLVLVLVEVGLFLFGANLRSNPQKEEASLPTVVLPSSVSKVETGEGRFQVSVAQGALCSKLAELQGYFLKNLTCLINENGIELSGKLRRFLPDNSSIVLWPEAKDGKISVKIKRFSIGNATMPSFLVTNLSSSVEKVVAASYPEIQKAKVTAVELLDGVMIIYGETQ